MCVAIIVIGSYKIEASHPDLKVEAKGSEQVCGLKSFLDSLAS